MVLLPEMFVINDIVVPGAIYGNMEVEQWEVYFYCVRIAVDIMILDDKSKMISISRLLL